MYIILQFFLSNILQLFGLGLCTDSWFWHVLWQNADQWNWHVVVFDGTTQYARCWISLQGHST